MGSEREGTLGTEAASRRAAHRRDEKPGKQRRNRARGWSLSRGGVVPSHREEVPDLVRRESMGHSAGADRVEGWGVNTRQQGH